MNEWEYKICRMGLTQVRTSDGAWVLNSLTEEQLTQYGSEGWELVSVCHITKVVSQYGPLGMFENVCEMQYIFKRLKQK